MRVYISGPYSQGDVVLNVRHALDAAEQVLSAGHIPYVPHLSHFWHLIYPHSWEAWVDIGLAWVELCDALIRLDGDSVGADQEVSWAEDASIPVYYGVAAFLDEIRRVMHEQEGDDAEAPRYRS